jgi:hypothetical protein
MRPFPTLDLRAPALLLGLATPLGALAQTPVTPPPTVIPASDIAVRIAPLVTVPPDSATAPLARILYVDPAPGEPDRLFINNVNGVLFETSRAGAPATPYLDLRTQGIGFVSGADPIAPGLNGFAFHPNFDGDPARPGYGKFYTTSWVENDGTGLTFTGKTDGALAVSIREWNATDPHAATFAGTSREVMRIAGYTTGHTNGMIAFNPTARPGGADYGMLYVGSGDGDYWDPNANAQNMMLPQGKILRIDPLAGPGGEPYTVPADNPFVGTPGTLPEIWAAGLRNPQSFDWDPLTGQMYINDIGQGLTEEVDPGFAGANYGWPYREGSYAKAIAFGGAAEDEGAYALPPGDAALGYTYAACSYGHDQGNALGSGLLYRGSAIPELDGKYVMADIVSGRLFACAPETGAMEELRVFDQNGPINLRDTFGYTSWLISPRVDARLSTDGDGEILLALKANGTVYTLADATVPEPGTAALMVAPLAMLLRRRRLAGRRAGL